MPDDEILSVNGHRITGFRGMVDVVSPLLGEKVTVEYKRGSAIDTVSLVTRIDSVHNEIGELIAVGRLGLTNKVWWEDIGFFGSIASATERTWNISVMLVGHLWKIITLQIPLKAIGGPLFIAEASGQVARLGAVALFSFIAMLSVNLAIVNVLPIPVLDGGHMVFLGIEAFRRRPLTLKQRAAVQQVGLAFLLVLIAMVTYNDFVRMFFE
jgi:regulator of sigma E protease